MTAGHAPPHCTAASSTEVIIHTPHLAVSGQQAVCCIAAVLVNQLHGQDHLVWQVQLYLHVGDTQQKLSLLSPANVVKDLTDSQRNNAWLILCPTHSMCLATASLTIGKDCTVEATNNLLDQCLCSLFVDLLSRPPLATNIVQQVRRFIDSFSCDWIDLEDLAVLVLPCGSFFCLLFIERPHTHMHTAELSKL